MIYIQIGIDIDETINNMIEKILLLYNEKYNDDLLYENIDQYDMSEFIKPDCKNIFQEFVNYDFIMNLDIQENAKRVITDLSKHHDIYFITAGHPYTLPARDDWLEKHFKFYRSSNLIMCREKQLLNVDWMIDDYENNLIEGKFNKILITKPWNRHISTEIYNIKRIFDWNEVPNIINNTY